MKISSGNCFWENDFAKLKKFSIKKFWMKILGNFVFEEIILQPKKFSNTKNFDENF